MTDVERRNLFKQLTGLAVMAAQPPSLLANSEVLQTKSLLRKQLPGKSEAIAAIGMGTWITFDVPDNAGVRRQRTEVLRTFLELGGQMIDSSPMYGQAESMLGHALERVQNKSQLFAASKIWTPLAADGRGQMTNTERLWQVNKMDLMFVHNLLSWRKHLPQLRTWKSEGRIRYTGLSTSHGRRHDELESLLKKEPVDFVQLTLNIDNIQVEDRLLPLAADRGVAVVVNRPFARGALIKKYHSRPLPAIAKELGCESWPQYLLLYAVSHPAVTCVIPATSRVDHMHENMATLQLELPDEPTRRAMRAAI